MKKKPSESAGQSSEKPTEPEFRRSDLPWGPLKDLFAWFKAEGVSGVLIGAVAVAFLGRPRTTRDVDALAFVPEERWRTFLAAGERFGYFPREPDSLAFAFQNRVLRLRHQPAGIDADISFPALPFEKELLKRAITVKEHGVTLVIPSPEDLVILKAVAHRPRDVGDIEGILDQHTKLDVV